MSPASDMIISRHTYSLQTRRDIAFVGVDAGGTKTDICACDIAGNVLARDVSAGVNAAQLGADRAARHIAARICHIGSENARSMYAGVAGAGSPAISAALEAALGALLPGITHIAAASDAFNALNSVVGLGDGVALIAGTGSSAFVRLNGLSRQVGGRGFLIDDAGSGYWVGRSCLNAAFRALDGRGPNTALVDELEKALCMPLPLAIPAIYENGAPFIASLAPAAFACAQRGDPAAVSIVSECARELVLHLRACRMHVPAGTVCAASGGLFRAPELRALIMQTAGLDMRIIFPDLPPVSGALVAAAAACGIAIAPAFPIETESPQ